MKWENKKKQRKAGWALPQTDLMGWKGLGSGLGLLLNCLIISRILEVGSDLCLGTYRSGISSGGSAATAGGLLGGLTERGGGRQPC